MRVRRVSGRRAMRLWMLVLRRRTGRLTLRVQVCCRHGVCRRVWQLVWILMMCYRPFHWTFRIFLMRRRGRSTIRVRRIGWPRLWGPLLTWRREATTIVHRSDFSLGQCAVLGIDVRVAAGWRRLHRAVLSVL